MVPAMLEKKGQSETDSSNSEKGKYIIRFCVDSKEANEEEIRISWSLITSGLKLCSIESSNICAAKLKRLRFGMSKIISDPRMNHNLINDANNNSISEADNSHSAVFKFNPFASLGHGIQFTPQPWLLQ